MKTSKLILIVLFLTFNYLSLKSAYAQAIEKKIASETQVIDGNPKSDSTFLDFSFLKKTLRGKRIVILGEMNHKEETALEFKVKLIRYLSQNLGYKTVALEGYDFFDSYLITHDFYKAIHADTLYGISGMSGIWKSWSKKSKELVPLDSLFLQKKINLLGIDNQSYNGMRYFVRVLKNYMNSFNLKILNEKEWSLLDSENQLLVNPDFSRFGATNDTSFYPLCC